MSGHIDCNDFFSDYSTSPNTAACCGMKAKVELCEAQTCLTAGRHETQ
jgi:hypothetical protein